MNVEALQHRMMVFLLLQSGNVYRMKGIFYSKDHKERVILQTVGKGMSVTTGKVWLDEDKKKSKIVIIGKQLKIDGYDKMFRTCLDL